jgi:hypothetical protein
MGDKMSNTKNLTNMDKYVRITDFEKYEENPFMPNLMEELTVRQRKQYLKSEGGDTAMFVVPSPDEPALAQAAFYQIQEVDESQFVKIFANFFSAQMGLSQTGKQVLIYFMTLLKPKNDLIRVRVDQALVFLGYKTKKSYLTGIGNLLEKGVIARTKYDDEFFINPLMMFNGDRVTFAKTFVKNKSIAAKETNQLDLFDFQPNPSFKHTKNQYNRITRPSEPADNEEKEPE